MGTAEDLRREAEAMERLASIVSYARDKQRLVEQAEKFKERAEQMEFSQASRLAGRGGDAKPQGWR